MAWRWSARGRPGRSWVPGWEARWSIGIGEGEHLIASDPAAIAPLDRARGVLAGRRGRAPLPARLRDPPPGARLDHAADRPDRLEARRRRAGRAQPLHAEGDPRAAEHRARRLPGPAPPLGGLRAVRRAEPLPATAQPRPPHRLRRVRHELARGARRRVPHRAARASARRGGIRRASSATATPRSTTARSSSS